MFWRKNKLVADPSAQLDELFRALGPTPILSLAKLGDEKLADDVQVDYVFLLIHANNVERFASNIASAYQVAKNHQAIVVANVGGLVQLAVGSENDEASGERHRKVLSFELAGALGGTAQIVHGRATSYVGTAGIADRHNWGFYPKKMASILQVLLSAIPGQPVEVTQIDRVRLN